MVCIRALMIIAIAAGVAFLLMVVMMTASGVKTASEGTLVIEYRPDTDGPARRPHLITPKIESDHPVTSVQVHHTTGNGFITGVLEQIPGTSWWATTLPGHEKGVRTYYYLTAEDASGRRVALPEDATDVWTGEYDYFKFRSEGQASRWALIVHIFLMFVAVFLFIHALYYALSVLYGIDRTGEMIATAYAGVIAFFITGFPIGWMIEKQVLGNYWEGIPLGWDITDSKTLFIFVFWMIPVILRLRRRLSDYGFARWVIAASLFTIVMFLLPHSL
ncbi:MAG: hypothetical protein KAW17_06710 [Candidatus Eisenbacteria sp.]|nr:hypothetical protein [Candidatus Eisenbacteria bacterium]